MRATWLWARSDVRRRWGSLALLAALVALTLGSVLALVAGAHRAGTTFERYFRNGKIPDVLVSTESTSTADRIEASPDARIGHVERGEMVVVAPAPVEPGNFGFTVVGTAGSPTGGFGRPALLSGRYPTPTSSDEIAVNERSATTYGFEPGQRVELRAIRCYVGCPPEPVGEATIVGVVRLATDLTADPQITGLAFGSPAFLDGRWRDLLHPASWLGVYVRDRDDVGAVVGDLSVLVTDGDVADARAATSPLDRAGRWQHNALAIAAAIVGLAGALVVAQALARHLAGRPDDPRVLAAMGIRPREVAAAGVLCALPGIVVGVVGGVALAVALSPLLPLGVVRRADPDVGVHAELFTLVPGIVAASLITVSVTALLAARWATASRSAAVKRSPLLTSRLAAEVGLRPVPAAAAQFALSPGQGRSRVPVIPTVFVLAGAITVVAGSLVVRWSLDGLVNGPDRYGQSYDLRIGLQDDAGATARRLAKDPRIRNVALTRQGAVNLVARSGTSMQVAATGVEALTGPAPIAVLEGRAPAGPREIALASATMNALGLREGDRTMASGACGQFEVQVVGRVIVPLTSSNYPDDGSIVALGTLDELCAADNVAAIDVNTSALVRLHHSGDLAAVRAEWQAQGFAVSDPETPNSVGLIRELRAVPVIVGGVVTVLGAAAAVHALMLTVRRRRRDLAVLQVFGLRPRQVGRIIVWQAVILALVGVGVGVPVGLLLGRLVWSAIAGSSNVVVRIDIGVLGLVVLGAVAMATAGLLAIWPAHRAARLRPADALRTE